MTDALVVLVIAALTTVGGIWFGIVVAAPRITRLLDRRESIEE